MTLVKAQVTFANDNGLSKDQVVNTFHFNAQSVSEAELESIVGEIENFYNAGSEVTGFSINHYLGSQLSTAVLATKVKFYTVAGGPPHFPVYESSFTLGVNSGSASMPSQVSCCLSYEALPANGQNQRTRRGRIYIGPLNVDASTAGADPRPSSAFTLTLREAGKSLALGSTALGSPWVIYSPTTEVGLSVQRLSTDNRFDIQRRRAAQPTARTLLLV